MSGGSYDVSAAVDPLSAEKHVVSAGGDDLPNLSATPTDYGSGAGHKMSGRGYAMPVREYALPDE